MTIKEEEKGIAQGQGMEPFCVLIVVVVIESIHVLKSTDLTLIESAQIVIFLKIKFIFCVMFSIN